MKKRNLLYKNTSIISKNFPKKYKFTNKSEIYLSISLSKLPKKFHLFNKTSPSPNIHLLIFFQTMSSLLCSKRFRIELFLLPEKILFVKNSLSLLTIDILSFSQFLAPSNFFRLLLTRFYHFQKVIQNKKIL